MNDIEAVEKVIAGLQDKRDRTSQRAEQIAAARRELGYQLHVVNSRAAAERLTELNAQMYELAETIASLDDALIEARRRLDQAHQVAAHAAGRARIGRVHEILDSLTAIAPKLDEGTGSAAPSAMPTSEQPRFFRNPPLQVKTAALIYDLFAELHALGIATEVKFPVGRWDVAARQDLMFALRKTLLAGWEYQIKRLPRNEQTSFKGLFAAWSRIIRTEVGADQKEIAA
jgi:hypothetical protein